MEEKLSSYLHLSTTTELLDFSRQSFREQGVIALMSKCCHTENENLKPKFSCKGISKKQNPMNWERYLEALNGSIDRASNTGFRLLGSGIVAYTESKLGVGACYDKRVVSPNRIHTEPLRRVS